MITLFSIPKPFKGHIGIIQRNALKSWINLGSGSEVILFGDDEGVAEVAEEFGVKHIQDVEKNEYGTPLLDFVFKTAEQVARNENICYVNADIIFLGDIIEAIRSVKFDKFLAVGQRWDIDINQLLDYESHGWEKKLKNIVETDGQLHPPAGSDFFIFPKGTLGDLPPFAVGRPGWDPWVIYRGRMLGIPVINITSVTTVIHQKHDYRHIPGGNGKSWNGYESDDNVNLMGGWDYVFSLQDANWILTVTGLKKKPLTRVSLIRALKILPILHPFLSPLRNIAIFFIKTFNKIKSNIFHL